MNKTYLAFTVIVAVMAMAVLPKAAHADGFFKVVTVLDKYNALKASLPDNVVLFEHSSREEYPAAIRKYQAYTQLNFMRGKHAIWTLKGNACLLEHEIKHTTDGPGHEGWPRRLMECTDNVEMG